LGFPVRFSVHPFDTFRSANPVFHRQPYRVPACTARRRYVLTWLAPTFSARRGREEGLPVQNTTEPPVIKRSHRRSQAAGTAWTPWNTTVSTVRTIRAHAVHYMSTNSSHRWILGDFVFHGVAVDSSFAVLEFALPRIELDLVLCLSTIAGSRDGAPVPITAARKKRVSFAGSRAISGCRRSVGPWDTVPGQPRERL
jgi:hypothetical protein